MTITTEALTTIELDAANAPIPTLTRHIEAVRNGMKDAPAEVAEHEKADRSQPGQVACPFAGVVTVIVEAGDQVQAGETVATIEAMKMEASITAPVAGRVERLALEGSRQLEGGDLVLVIA